MSTSKEEEIKRTLEMFEESQNWFSDHYEELEKKYQDMLLAIMNKKIISAYADLDDLFEDLKTKNVDVSSVFIASIPPKGIAFIL